jgi:transcription elongation GreA/GreB family factor
MVSKDGKATVGAWVTIQDGESEELWRIVPRIEADVLRRWMSEECPLARAILGHAAGDVVQVQGPEGRRLVTVLAVQPAAGS